MDMSAPNMVTRNGRWITRTKCFGVARAWGAGGLRCCGVWVASILATLLQVSVAGATSITTGDILACNRGFGSPIVVNATTGVQALFPSAFEPPSSGAYDAVSNSSGQIFLAFALGGPIYSMDRITGSLTLLSSLGPQQSPYRLALAPDGMLFVLDGSSGGRVVRVDPASGAQTLVASGRFEALAIDGQGNGYVIRDDAQAVRSRRHLYRMDLATGTVVRISNLDVHDPGGLAVDGAGQLIVVDNQHDPAGPLCTVFRVDPIFEIVAVVSEDAQLMQVFDSEVAADGTIVLADHQTFSSCAPPGGTNSCPGAIFKLSPSTGAATLLSSGGNFDNLQGLTIYRGPSTVTPTKRSSWGQLKAIYR